MNITVIPIVIGTLGIILQGLVRGPGRVGNQTSQDHPNYSIVEVGQNTEKSPGDLKKLAITQPPVKDHQLPVKDHQLTLV